MLTRHAGLQPGKPPARAIPLRVVPAGRPVLRVVRDDGDTSPVRPARPRNRTGFSDAVKLAVRTRAGNGDPDDACCEATGVWLGRYGGEIQHRDARGMGGTSLEVTGSIVNAVLLSAKAHRLAESRDAAMNTEGFWLRHGQDPAATPILLHSQRGGGFQAWLTPDGGYDFDGPDGGAAA